MSENPLKKVFLALQRQNRFTDERAAALRTAYAIADHCHADQKRKSGQPYITHPVQVAEITVGWNFPFPLVPAALLHDVADYTCAAVIPIESLRGRVSDDVISILHLQNDVKTRHDPFTLMASRPTTLPGTGDLPPQALAASAVALRIADRLHNARTWQYVEPDKARARAQETLDLIAPVAAAAELPAARDELLKLSLHTLRRTRPPRRPALGAAAHHSYRSSDHLTQSLLHRAVDALPQRLRGRYAEEWAADLASLTSTRQRMKFAAGLQYSARRLASDTRR